MCMWSEVTAGRGADEICSCLKQYISSLPPNVKTLTCFSDSCFGQNKNFNMICFWNLQIIQGRFIRIDHKFLVKGLTYLPNDRDFSHIEKRKDTAIVHIPSHWERVVEEARVQDPFTVKRMELLLLHWSHKAHTPEKGFRRKRGTNQQSSLDELWAGWGRQRTKSSEASKWSMDSLFFQWGTMEQSQSPERQEEDKAFSDYFFSC